MSQNAFNANPIQWYEGMFVMPQHFQQNDTLQKNLWHYHFQRLNPYHWGLCDMTVDESSLAAGVLRILSLECVLEDGTVIFYPYHKGETLELDLKTSIEEDDIPRRVHLTLPKSTLKDLSEGQINNRYKPVEEASADLNSPETKITIMRLLPRLALSAEKVLPVQCTAIPIMEVIKKNQKFSITSYSPPFLYLKRKSTILKKCSEIVRSVRDKLVYLSKKVKFQTQVTQSLFDAHSIWQFELTRRHLIHGLVDLEVVIAQDKTKPFDVYKALLKLANICAELRWGEAPPNFPEYTHENIQPILEVFYRFIQDTLDNVEETYRIIPFKQKERVFSLELDNNWIHKTMVLGIKSNTEVTEAEMQKWADNAVIASDSFIESAQSNRVLGARRRRIQAASHMKLIPDKGTLLYEVTFDTRFITRGEALHVFNIADSAEKRPKEVILYTPIDESA